VQNDGILFFGVMVHPRLISSTIMLQGFNALQGGWVAGEMAMHWRTSCRDISSPAVWRQEGSAATATHDPKIQNEMPARHA
jgi:hypothetical protein